MVARISSLTTRPLQPMNCFSARNALISDSRRERSPGGRWRTAGTLRSTATMAPGASGRAMCAARRRARHSGAASSQASTPIASRATATIGVKAASAVGLLQALDQLDVVFLRLRGVGALELGPGVVLGAVDETERAGALAAHVAGRRLLEGGVQTQHVGIVRALGELLYVRLRRLELLVQVCHA